MPGAGVATAGAVTGVPAPLATGMRIGVKQIQDAKLRKRIERHEAVRLPDDVLPFATAA